MYVVKHNTYRSVLAIVVSALLYYFCSPTFALPNSINKSQLNGSYWSLNTKISGYNLSCFSYQGVTGLAIVQGKLFTPSISTRKKLRRRIRRSTRKQSISRKSKIQRWKNQLSKFRKAYHSCRSTTDTTNNPEITSIAPPSNFKFPKSLKHIQQQYENNMINFGREHCALLSNAGAFDPKLAATYYDATWVFYQIKDYTSDPSWSTCIQAALNIYRDRYVLNNNGYIPGYWNFPHGLAIDFERTRNSKSFQALKLMSQNAAYARDTTALHESRHTDFSREVAYAILSYIEAERVGLGARKRLHLLVNQALEHIKDWTSGRAPYVRPFMVALTAQALISVFEKNADPRIPPALKKALNHIWQTTWIESQQSFQYTDRNRGDGGKEPAPDLNLLIAPAFAWFYYQSGELSFLERSIKIYEGGVYNAYLGNPKQFIQNYRWSLQGLYWLSRN